VQSPSNRREVTSSRTYLSQLLRKSCEIRIEDCLATLSLHYLILTKFAQQLTIFNGFGRTGDLTTSYGRDMLFTYAFIHKRFTVRVESTDFTKVKYAFLNLL